jgi:DNA-binding FadR family transcriptional regulator
MTRRSAENRVIPCVQTSSEEIAEKLTRRIFLREFPVGSKLPSERDLAVQLGVARNVVREAIKRLEAIGAVRSWRGSGAYVQSIEFMRGVDLFDTLITLEDGSVNLDFLREVIEFNENFTRLVVRLAAVHRSDEQLAALKELVREWRAHSGDAEQEKRLSNEIRRSFIEATNNRVCEGLYNTLERISVKLFALAEATVLDSEGKERAFRRLIEALEERDAMMAEAVVVRYLRALEERISLGGVLRGLV